MFYLFARRWLAPRYVYEKIMIGDRLILLGQQLKSKKPNVCKRCSLPYGDDHTVCPHCTGLSERQIEELIKKSNQAQLNTIWYLVFLLLMLGAFLTIILSN